MSMTRKKLASIATELRRAVAQAEKGGRTRYELAKQAGLDRSLLTRLMAGKSIALGSAEKLAAALGKRLELND